MYPLRFECGHVGCKETVTYRYDTLRDRKDSFEARVYSGGKWRCSRHNRPDEVLSASNQQAQFEVVSEERPYGRFFGSSGFISGPGFKLFANDFPAGTKLIVTARIELPPAEE